MSKTIPNRYPQQNKVFDKIDNKKTILYTKAFGSIQNKY